MVLLKIGLREVWVIISISFLKSSLEGKKLHKIMFPFYG